MKEREEVLKNGKRKKKKTLGTIELERWEKSRERGEKEEEK